jgi:UDP-2,3-diacylglucosamine hydrolase
VTAAGGAGAARATSTPKEWSAAFAADLHLAPADRDGIARAIQLVELCRARAERLWLLGDVFDLWTSGAELAMAEFQPLFAALRAARADGLAIDFLAGNRDFNLTARDGERAGMTAHAEEEVEVTLAGRRYLLLHGDQLLTDDVAYQRFKKFVRSGWFRFLTRRVPDAVSFAIGRRLRRYSDRVVGTKPLAKLRIVPAAVRARLPPGAASMLCGHVHRLERIDYGEGRELLVLPPFYEEGRFVVATGDGLRVATLAGALADLPAARAPDCAAFGESLKSLGSR